MIVEKRADDLRKGDVLPVGKYRYTVTHLEWRGHTKIRIWLDTGGKCTFPHDSLFDVEVEENATQPCTRVGPEAHP